MGGVRLWAGLVSEPGLSLRTQKRFPGRGVKRGAETVETGVGTAERWAEKAGGRGRAAKRGRHAATRGVLWTRRDKPFA